MALGSLGDLVLALSADTSKFQSDLGKANREAEKFGKDVARTLGKLAGALVALGGATGFGALVRGQIDAADAAGKMAQKIGVSTEALSSYMVAARLSDVSNEQLQTGFQQLAKNQADFVRGTGEAREAFMALGITTEQVNALNGDTAKLFDLVAGKLASFEDGANKTALAMRIFGRSGAELIPLINGLEDTRKEAEELGRIIDTETAKAAERFNDNLTRVGLAIQGLALATAKDLLPVLEAMSDEFVETAKGAQQFNFVGEAAKTVLQTLAVVGSDVAFVFKMIGGEIGVWAAQLAALARGDFAGFSLIGEEWRRDAAQARADLDEFQRRIMGLSETSKKAADGISSVPRAVSGKSQAPGLGDAKQAQKDADFLAKQLEESAEEERRIQMEAWHWTAFYANKKLEEEKAFQAAKLQAIIEAYDREQELAIQQGAILAEDPSHSVKLEQLRQSLMSQEELEIQAHEMRMERLKEFSDEELEALGGRQSIEFQMEAEHQARLMGLRSRSHAAIFKIAESFRKKDYASAMSNFADLTSGLAQHSKTWFEINKAAGIATAISNAYIGISRTLAAYPFPFNVALAAAHAVVAFAQVQAIRSSSFGSTGGAAPSLAGSTAATPVSPVDGGAPQSERQQPTTIINFKGDGLVSSRDMRALLKSIEEATRDGGRVFVA